jgi:hypothetical protein
MVRCEAGLAAAILHGAVAYARALGFEPHSSFGKVSEILEDVEPRGGDDVEFGDAGRPLYIAGPHDDPRAVVARLTQRLGADGFGFIVPIDPEEGLDSF